MYLFRMKDGSIIPAPDDFSPASPDWEKMGDVQDVLYVNKIFEKQLRLVPRPVEERAQIRANQKESRQDPEDREQEVKPAPTKRRNNGPQ